MAFHHDFVVDWLTLPIPDQQIVDKEFDQHLPKGVNLLILP